MKKPILFFIAIALLGITACKRKTIETFYFSCYINGQYFEPEKQQGLGEYPITAKLLNDDILLDISAGKGVKSVSLGVFDTTKIREQEYFLSMNKGWYSRALYKSSLAANHYETDSIFTGKVNIIQLDKANMIVAGTFHFTGYNAETKDTVHITDGKFKLKYDLH